MDEITIKDVARACNVAVSTVSRAINNHPNINEETKELIMRKIQELGYVPNNSARNLKRTDANAIAVLVKGMTNPFFNVMIKIMEIDIKEHGYSMVLQHVDPSEDEVDVALELTKERRLSGIIFLGGIVARTGGKLTQLNVPYVLSTVGARLAGVDGRTYSSIAVDDEKEGMKATEFLIKKGRKRIAILTGAKNDTSIGMLRLNGYKRALFEAGIPLDSSLIRYLPEDNQEYTFDTGYSAARGLLDENIEFDAIFAIADVMAVGAMRALLEAGKKIPGEVAVLGFDGIDLTRFCTPSLSTVSQPIRQMASETSKLLFDIIDFDGEHKHMVFDANIIERETT